MEFQKFITLLGKIPIIFPNHKFKLLINFIIFLFNLIEFFYIPVRLAFPNFPQKMANLKILMNAFFVLDILFSFITGYYYRGTLIMSRKEIIQNYLKKNFWMDILTLLPLIFLDLFVPSDSSWRFFEYFFMFRVLNLDVMLNKIWDYYSCSETVNYILKITKLMIWIYFMAHIIACLMYKISDDEDSQEKIINFNLENFDSSFFDQYICILYWAFETILTIGYGDVVSKNKKEKIFNIFGMLITCCVFMSIMSKIGEMIDDMRNKQSFINEKIYVANQYLDKKTKDEGVKLRVRKYLEYIFEEKQRLTKEGKEIVLNLSNSLKLELLQSMNSDILNKMTILKKNFGWNFLCGLANSMNEIAFTPEEWIIDVDLLI